MKKWQEFLLWVVCFAFIDAVFELIKSLAENEMLNRWTFAWGALAILVAGWFSVLFGIKSLQNKKSCQKNNFVVGLSYFVLVLSVCLTFDVMKYSLENDMLNKWYFFCIGFVFMFLGWAAGRLDNILPKKRK